MRVALIDLYNGEPNLGIQAIKDLVNRWGKRELDTSLQLDHFETRKTGDVPDLSYDAYLLSGGPGSPFDGEGTAWETAYFELVGALWQHNKQSQSDPKYALFICHSFQMMCRHFGLGDVVQRKSTSFGVFETHQTAAGHTDPLFEGLQDPFYVADFRDWQAIQPRTEVLGNLGASVLALEKQRPHIPMERALMGFRLSTEMVGVQFHPEADPAGMLVHFQKDARRAAIIKTHGEEKFNQIISRLEDPEFLLHTYQRVIPNFLADAVAARKGMPQTA
ncbi:MAG: GMP synthase [Bacteroidota bacterium]